MIGKNDRYEKQRVRGRRDEGRSGVWWSDPVGGFMLGAALSQARTTAAVAVSMFTGSLM